MIGHNRRSEEAGEFDPAVAVWCAQHGYLDVLMAQSSDTSGPFPFDCGALFELKTKLGKKFNRRSEVLDDDSDIVHPLERHVSNLQSFVQIYKELTRLTMVGDKRWRRSPRGANFS